MARIRCRPANRLGYVVLIVLCALVMLAVLGWTVVVAVSPHPSLELLVANILALSAAAMAERAVWQARPHRRWK